MKNKADRKAHTMKTLPRSVNLFSTPRFAKFVNPVRAIHESPLPMDLSPGIRGGGRRKS
jgi:hypothetical protein